MFFLVFAFFNFRGWRKSLILFFSPSLLQLLKLKVWWIREWKTWRISQGSITRVTVIIFFLWIEYVKNAIATQPTPVLLVFGFYRKDQNFKIYIFLYNYIILIMADSLGRISWSIAGKILHALQIFRTRELCWPDYCKLAMGTEIHSKFPEYNFSGVFLTLNTNLSNYSTPGFFYTGFILHLRKIVLIYTYVLVFCTPIFRFVGKKWLFGRPNPNTKS